MDDLLSRNDRWTPNDEREFLMLQERRTRVVGAREVIVRNVAEKLIHESADYDSDIDPATLTKSMIKHADTIRDALSPFDSGIRAKEQ